MNVGKVGSTNLIQVVNVGQKIVSGQGIGKKAASGIVLRVEKKADLEQFKPGMILAVAALENEMGTAPPSLAASSPKKEASPLPPPSLASTTASR